jgi:hypothetical protein
MEYMAQRPPQESVCQMVSGGQHDDEEVAMADLRQERLTEEYLTIAQLRARINYSPQSIRNMVARGIFRLGLDRESATIDIPLTHGL